MREMFRSYYPPTPAEKARALGECVVVVDANLLVGLYRYRKSTRDELLNVFASLAAAKRLFVPNQAAEEYHRARLIEFARERDRYASLLAKFEAIRTELRQTIDLSNATETAIESVGEFLGDWVSQNPRVSGAQLFEEDQVLSSLTEILDECVGSAYSVEELKEIYQAGKERFEKKVPPGFRDKDKPEPARYGDFVLWRQILDMIRDRGTSVLFVTDDRKDDWWQKHNSDLIGPRRELIQEAREAGASTYCR